MGYRGLEEFEGPLSDPCEGFPVTIGKPVLVSLILPALKWQKVSVLLSLISAGPGSVGVEQNCQRQQSLDASLPRERLWHQSRGLSAPWGGERECGWAGKVRSAFRAVNRLC